MKVASHRLTRLLQLASPTLPVGAFSYSQGLEWLTEDGTVRNAADAARWIGDAMQYGAAALDAPAMVALMRVWLVRNFAEVPTLNGRFVAMRETAESRAETIQMGRSLARLLREMNALPAGFEECLSGCAEPAFPTVWSAAAVCWEIDEQAATEAYLWAWLENLVMAAIKLVPLGQTAGQRMLFDLADKIPALSLTVLSRADGDWYNFAQGIALAGSYHEAQYTRLYRS